MDVDISDTQDRYVKFEKWLGVNDFDKLLYRLILIHNDEYIENFYLNGEYPKLNNVFNFIIDYINSKKLKSRVVDNDVCKEFNGYLFSLNDELKIYNLEDKRLIFEFNL